MTYLIIQDANRPARARLVAGDNGVNLTFTCLACGEAWVREHGDPALTYQVVPLTPAAASA